MVKASNRSKVASAPTQKRDHVVLVDDQKKVAMRKASTRSKVASAPTQKRDHVVLVHDQEKIAMRKASAQPEVASAPTPKRHHVVPADDPEKVAMRKASAPSKVTSAPTPKRHHVVPADDPEKVAMRKASARSEVTSVPAQKRVRVVLVDDHEIVREGIRRMLELHPEIHVVGEAGNVEEALQMVESTAPDIVLMDIKLPDGNGLEATRRLKEKGGPWEIIILSLYDQYLPQAIEAGAAGYLSKDLSRMDLVNVIMRVYKGELVLGDHLTADSNLLGESLRQLQELIKERRAAPAQPRGEATPEASATLPTPFEVAITPPIASPIPVPLPSIASNTPSSSTSPVVAALDKAATPQESIDQQTAEKWARLAEGKAPAEEVVEIAIAPPVDAHMVINFCSHVREATSAEIVATIGSADKGTVMVMGLRKPVPLLDILSNMPEVATAWEKPKQVPSHIFRLPFISHKAKEPSPDRQRIHVVLKEDVAQLALNM